MDLENAQEIWIIFDRLIIVNSLPQKGYSLSKAAGLDQLTQPLSISYYSFSNGLAH